MKKYIEFDPVDAAFLYGTSIRSAGHPVGVLRRIASIVSTLVKPFAFLSLRTTRLVSKKIVFFVTTKNQEDAVFPVAEALLELGEKPMLLSDKDGNIEKIKIGVLELLAFYPMLFFWYSLTRKKIRALDFRVAVKSYFYYFLSLRILKDFDGVVIFSNDHSLAPRSVFLGAKMRTVRTAYIQHAAVTELFPPLTFDYSFLDGRNSTKKYQAIALRTGASLASDVYEVGCPKADAFFLLAKQRVKGYSPSAVGLAINPLDDFDAFFTKAAQFLDEGATSVRFRPHPRLKLSESQRRKLLGLGQNFIWHEGEKLADFLSHIEILVAGDTGLHLEAVASGALSIYMKFGSTFNDYYGFVGQRLSRSAENVTDVLHLEKEELASIREEQGKSLCGFYNNAALPDGASIAVARKLVEIINESAA